jgi:NAD(P)-dependent dehydrogenase (short-subunit alcohol dehydrogenase family)
VSAPAAVLVTGGTGALGRVVVKALLTAGARVAVPYRSEADWDALRAGAPSGAGLWGARADLADAAAARAFADEAAGRLGGLDGLAALAGAFAASGTLEASPAEEWRAMMTTNLDTAWAICRAALPHLLRGGGTAVTVASKLAESGGAGAAAYAVSKAGVIALTRVLARENQARGVRFNCIVPGVIDTPANRRAMTDTSHFVPPEAIARVVLFLLSPDSAPVTGATVPVDA